jgi:hypothetical protein
VRALERVCVWRALGGCQGHMETLPRLHGHAASPRGSHGEHLSELFRACVAACALPSTLPQPFTAMKSPRCSVLVTLVGRQTAGTVVGG